MAFNLKEEINSAVKAFASLFPGISMKAFPLDEGKAQKLVNKLVDGLQAQAEEARESRLAQIISFNANAAGNRAKMKIRLPEKTEQALNDKAGALKTLRRLGDARKVRASPLIMEALNGKPARASTEISKELPFGCSSKARNSYNFYVRLPKNGNARENAFEQAFDLSDTFKSLKKPARIAEVRETQLANKGMAAKQPLRNF